MPARSPRRKRSAAPPGDPAFGLRVRLQILAGFLLPILAIVLWLNSRGFFASP